MYNNQEITENHIKNYIDTCENVIAKDIARKNPYGDNKSWDVNMHSITDKLIADVGRYCEMHGSDMLITLNSLNKALETDDIQTRFFVFGIRRHGVDGISYLQSRINDNPQILTNDYYRAIYAIQLNSGSNEFTKEPELTIELKDISSISIYSLINK